MRAFQPRPVRWRSLSSHLYRSAGSEQACKSPSPRANKATGSTSRGPRTIARAPHSRSRAPFRTTRCIIYVEKELGIREGFWGMVADGRHPEEIAGDCQGAGHASAKRAGIPDPSIVPILQAERIVECFEADLWSRAQTDLSTLRATIDAGCASFIRSDAGDNRRRDRADSLRVRGLWRSVGQRHRRASN